MGARPDGNRKGQAAELDVLLDELLDVFEELLLVEVDEELDDVLSELLEDEDGEDDDAGLLDDEEPRLSFR